MHAREISERIERWNRQFRKGVLELAVMLCVAEVEQYGYELVRRVTSVAGGNVGEGTIYPLLARLEREGLIQSRWDAAASARPRRYYRLTERGRALTGEMLRRWTALNRSLAELAGEL